MLQLKELCLESPVREPTVASGRVSAIKGGLILARLPFATIGDWCAVELQAGNTLKAQVVAFDEMHVTLAPLGPVSGVAPNAKVLCRGEELSVRVSEKTLGRILDALGNPIDGQTQDNAPCSAAPLYRNPPSSLERAAINEQLATGLRGIDSLCPIGYGQRLGIFAGAGAGKSTLMACIAGSADVDVTVVALVGERGREVRDFIEECLGEKGRKRSIVVVATSDECPLRRVLAPYSATAIAEYFRDQGKRVLLLVDSITRFARALREVGVAAGELPVRNGYTASVFRELPSLFERAGAGKCGSITALYTLLTAEDTDSDPLAEEAKSLLDGHIVLSKHALQNGWRPAIDYTQSISRLAHRIQGSELRSHANILRGILAKLKRDKDILLLGGTPDSELKACLHVEKSVYSFLHQEPGSLTDLAKIQKELEVISKDYTRNLQDTPKHNSLIT